MFDDALNKSDFENLEILKYIFRGSNDFHKKIAPNGWINSGFIHFFHPTPQQQFDEHIQITDNLNSLFKKQPEKIKAYRDISEFKQDDLADVNEREELLYVLGLTVYDIFSNNHEVVGGDGKIYDFGSFRGSGRFIADFFNNNFKNLSIKYDYMDFYMGSIYIKSRADMLPFFEYVFHKLKEMNCDWDYHFPRMYLINPSEMMDTVESEDMKDYDPGQSVAQELKISEDDKKVNELREDLDSIYREEFEEAKYKPLKPIIQAYKNVYGVLPNGHPQKEFE